MIPIGYRMLYVSFSMFCTEIQILTLLLVFLCHLCCLHSREIQQNLDWVFSLCKKLAAKFLRIPLRTCFLVVSITSFLWTMARVIFSWPRTTLCLRAWPFGPFITLCRMTPPPSLVTFTVIWILTRSCCWCPSLWKFSLKFWNESAKRNRVTIEKIRKPKSPKSVFSDTLFPSVAHGTRRPDWMWL